MNIDSKQKDCNDPCCQSAQTEKSIIRKNGEEAVENNRENRLKMGNIHTVGPNEALIVSGGCCGSTKKQTIVGGWAWAWW